MSWRDRKSIKKLAKRICHQLPRDTISLVLAFAEDDEEPHSYFPVLSDTWTGCIERLTGCAVDFTCCKCGHSWSGNNSRASSVHHGDTAFVFMRAWARMRSEQRLVLADDNIADDDLTRNPPEVGTATAESNADGGDSMSTDEGLPVISRGRTRISNSVAPMLATKIDENATGLATEMRKVAPPAVRRRLSKKTQMPAPHE